MKTAIPQKNSITAKEFEMPEQFTFKLAEFESESGQGLSARLYKQFPSKEIVSMPALAEVQVPVMLDGQIAYEIKGASKFKGENKQGEMTIVQANAAHTCRVYDAEKEYFYYIVLFADPVFHAQVALETFDKDPKRVNLIDYFSINDPLMLQLALTFKQQLLSSQPDKIYLESLSQFGMVHLLKHYAEQLSIPHGLHGKLRADYLKRVLDYIETNIHQNLSLEELASLVNLSRFHFCRIFKQTTGESVHQYILQRRLKKAYQLIRNTHLNFAEISQQTGFSDQSHLSRCFKKFYGLPPKDFRK